MSKLAGDTVVLTPNEEKYVNFDFTDDLGSEDVGAISAVTISPAGITEDAVKRGISGKLAQIFLKGNSASEGVYTVTVKITSDGVTTQTFEGVGEVTVEAAG